jgi:hypothetical protein
VLVAAFLLAGWAWPVWTVAALAGLAAAVRAGQVAEEERTA